MRATAKEMRFFAGFTLLFISIALVQGHPVVPQINNLNGIISLLQVEQSLTPDKLQQLQNQIFVTIAAARANHWNVATLAQALQQLVTQYVPQVAQMRIDWEAVSQSAINDIATFLPNSIIDALGGAISRRDLRPNDLQMLGQLPPEKLAQILEVVYIPDRPTALGRLRQLLQQFFPKFQGRGDDDDFDSLCENLLNNLNNILTQFKPYSSSNPGH